MPPVALRTDPASVADVEEATVGEPTGVTVAPDANRDMETNSHSGHEFDYVLEGVLRLRVGGQETELYPGDCAYYDSIHPHAMQAVGDKECKFLAIVIP